MMENSNMATAGTDVDCSFKRKIATNFMSNFLLKMKI